jgi:hypothetical protein
MMYPVHMCCHVGRHRFVDHSCLIQVELQLSRPRLRLQQLRSNRSRILIHLWLDPAATATGLIAAIIRCCAEVSVAFGLVRSLSSRTAQMMKPTNNRGHRSCRRATNGSELVAIPKAASHADIIPGKECRIHFAKLRRGA